MFILFLFYLNKANDEKEPMLSSNKHQGGKIAGELNIINQMNSSLPEDLRLTGDKLKIDSTDPLVKVLKGVWN